MNKNVAFYDLSAAPITFDFIHFLALARMHFASTTGTPLFRLIVLVDKWRNVTPRERSYGPAERLWRLHNLIIPVISMSPFVVSFEVTVERPSSLPQGNNIFPVGYDLDKPSIPYMTANLVKLFNKTGILPQYLVVPEQAKKYASQMLSKVKNPCLVSIRASSFEPERDTPSSLLTESVKYITDHGFDPVIIPDQESINQNDLISDANCCVLHEAAFSLPLRLAISEQSKFSIFSPSGLSSVCSLLRSSPSMVIYGLLGDHYLSTEEFCRNQGYNVYDSKGLPWTPVNQYWVWDSSKVTVWEALESVIASSNKNQ